MYFFNPKSETALVVNINLYAENQIMQKILILFKDLYQMPTIVQINYC